MQNFAKKAQIFGEDFFNEKCKTISPLRCVGYYKINFLNLVEQFVMTLLELESKDSHESITKYRELIKQYLCAQFCAGLSIGLIFFLVIPVCVIQLLNPALSAGWESGTSVTTTPLTLRGHVTLLTPPSLLDK